MINWLFAKWPWRLHVHWENYTLINTIHPTLSHRVTRLSGRRVPWPGWPPAAAIPGAAAGKSRVNIASGRAGPMPLYGHTGENSPPPPGLGWPAAGRTVTQHRDSHGDTAGDTDTRTLSYGFCLQGTFKKFSLVSCPLAQSWLISENHLLLRKKYAMFWGPPIIDMRFTTHRGPSVITA